MGLKGYRLWGMGQLDSNLQRPTGCGVTTASPEEGGNWPDSILNVVVLPAPLTRGLRPCSHLGFRV
jgi:hypothetical protein